jgi:DNA-binding Xre family transcriptional regulator
MQISYNNLWKLMIDRKLKKKYLYEIVGLSRTTVSHLNHDEHVSTESLMKICEKLQCNIGDIVSFVNTSAE